MAGLTFDDDRERNFFMSFVVIPLQGMNISNVCNLFGVEIIPADQFSWPDNNFEFFDLSGKQEGIKELFCGKTVAKVHFTVEEFDQKYALLNPEDDLRIMQIALARVESVLDVFRLFYCDVATQEIVINRAGNIRGCCAVGFLFGAKSLISKYVELKIYSARWAPSGYEVYVDIENVKNMLGGCQFKGEVGNYLKFGLRHFREIIFQDNKTSKFLQIMTLFEFLAFPEEYRPFKEVKKEIAALVALDGITYDALLERFHELTSKAGFGYRTEIVHNGKEVLDFFESSTKLNVFFEELGFYITSYFYKAFRYSGRDVLSEFYIFRDLEKANVLASRTQGSVLLPLGSTRSFLLVDFNFIIKKLEESESFYKKKWDENFQDLVSNLLQNCRLDVSMTKVLLCYKDLNASQRVKKNFAEMQKSNDNNISCEVISCTFAHSLFKHLTKYSMICNRFFVQDSCYEYFGIVADDAETNSAISLFLASNEDVKISMIRNYHNSEIDLHVPYVNADHIGPTLLKIPKLLW